MTQPIVQVDAFTDKPFAGNPAAVCLLPEPRDEAWMQQVAAEMNLSETAFLVRRDDGFDLRWFTPAVEVDLCGHATLAAAHALWEDGHLRRDHTRTGLLTARRDGDWIAMDFPTHETAQVTPPADLARALGAEPACVVRSPFDYLVELATEEVVRGLSPDISLVESLGQRGVIVTARASTEPYDYVCRFFAPAAGVPEDPVTGSAQSALAPYWAERLGKSEMLSYQASARGGVVRTALRGDRVIIAGQAVTTLRGELVA